MLQKLIALFRMAGSVDYREHRLIKEKRMKILFNPFVKTYMWCLLNPKTRIWEWFRDATDQEVKDWLGEEIGEWKGDKK